MRPPLLLLLIAVLSVAPALTAQEIQGPEPGVFIYSYDQTTSRYQREYVSTQVEARQRLDPQWTAAEAVAASLNAQAQSNVNARAVAEWLVFFEQWHLWQGWVKQEYGVTDLGQARFEAVPGQRLRWEAAAQNTTGTGPGQQTMQTSTGGPPGLAAGEGLEGERLAGGGTQTQTPQAPAGPPVTHTIMTFMAKPPAEQQATVADIREAVEDMVAEEAQTTYDRLWAILDEIDAAADSRERRAIFQAARDRDITDLTEIILNRRSATEIEIGDRLYLFSDRPLSRIPEDAINIPTPNLTPYDIFEADGTVRQTP